MEEVKKIKFAFHIKSSYGLLMALKFVYFNNEKSLRNSDFFISTSIPNCRQIAKSIKKSGIVNGVYLINNHTKSEILENRKKRKNECQVKIKLLIRINKILKKLMRYITKGYRLLSVSYFENYFAEKKYPRRNEIKYEIIVCQSMAIHIEMFLHYYKHQKKYFIEDGFGSYAETISLTKRRQVFEEIFGIFEKANKLYLNYPNLSKNKWARNYKIKGNIDDNFVLFVGNIFGYNNETNYRKYRGIFLHQPLIEFHRECKLINNFIIDYTKEEYNNEIIFRYHPKDIKLSEYKKYNLWELIALNEINDKQLLITVFSTAAVTPKLLFGKEPYIIFLYKLIPFKKGDARKIDATIKMITKCYNNQKKVFVPNTFGEFCSILKRCI